MNEPSVGGKDYECLTSSEHDSERLSPTIEAVPDRLYFTESDEANALIASDPMALLVGFELDQRVTVMKAFEGPLALKQRLGAIDAATLASADLEQALRRGSRARARAATSDAGRVDSPQALEQYQAAKREHKAEWAKARS
jgi:hypothetical protein